MFTYRHGSSNVPSLLHAPAITNHSIASRMVSTRGGARTAPVDEPAMEDVSMTMRKKPVRKATAAKAAPAAKAPAAKGRATRSKKAEPEPLHEEADELAEEPAPVAKRSTRSRRAATIDPEPSETVAEESENPVQKPRRATRTTSTKNSKSDKQVEETPAPASKQSLATKPTRQTRAKAAAQPLSPKKITQVAQTRTRSTKNAEEKTSKTANSTRATAGTQRARATRQRTVSDENADVPDLAPFHEGETQEDTVVPTPAKAASPRKATPRKADAEESDNEMSSGPTTPSDSPAPTFDQPKSYAEDKLDAGISDAEQTEDDEEEQSGSEDELSGAKTPMKRSISRDQPRFYTSPQKHAKPDSVEVPAVTPARRYGANGPTRPTPHTQKPANRREVPASEVCPMTVARGSDRAFVFKELKAATPVESVHAHIDKAPASTEDDRMDAGDDDVDDSFALPRSNDTDEAVRHAEDDEDINAQSENEIQAEAGADPDATIVIEDDEGESMLSASSPSIQAPVSRTAHLASESPEIAAPVATYKSDEESVVITRPDEHDYDSQSDEEQAGDSFAFLETKTPKPETIKWENLREDVTIPIDFDLHFADVRSPPRPDAAAETGNFSPVVDMEKAEEGEQTALNDVPRDENLTADLNEIIDFAALTEPTLRLDVQAAAAEAEESLLSSQGPDEESPVSEQENDELPPEVDEPTVIITRNSPAQSAFAPASPPQAADVSGSEQTSTQTVAEELSPTRKLRQSIALMSPSRPESGIRAAAEEQREEAVEDDEGEPVPHYAIPTISSRRKSVPAISHQTPVNSGARPNTSDGASIARMVNPFEQPWWSRSTATTPVRSRPSFSQGASTAKRMSAETGQESPMESPATARQTPLATPGERFPRFQPRERYGGLPQTVAVPARFKTPARTPVKRPATVQKLASQAQAQRVSPAKEVNITPTPSATQTPVATPKQRYPLRAARSTYDEYASTVAAPARFQTPAQPNPKRPATVQRLASQPEAKKQKELTAAETPNVDATPAATPKQRYPLRTAQSTYDEHASTVAAPSRFRTPTQQRPNRPATVQRMASQAMEQPVEPATPASPVATPKARFPRLAPRTNYEEHASTVAAPARFQTPPKPSPRRPATTRKPADLRKVALTAQTPMKTPLKPAATTPGQVPMTPHPSAPLRGVVALVEVFTLDGASASAPFVSLLQSLGAKATKAWSDRITHVVFKEGSPTTLQRVRLHNKDVQESGKGLQIHCVNSRWVSDCDAQGSRVDESDEAYAVDVTEVPRGGGRRRKSMEPSALVNIGGNIVRDRKSSFGRRSSLGRSPMKFDVSPVKIDHQVAEEFDKENDDASEPATPAYLKAPEELVQQTAPMNRVSKLDLAGKEKNRRLTFWNGGV